MSASRTAVFSLAIFVLFFAVPAVTQAVGADADSKCTPWHKECGCGEEPDKANPGKCKKGVNTNKCLVGICYDDDGKVKGICTAKLHCEGITCGGVPCEKTKPTPDVNPADREEASLIKGTGEAPDTGGGAPPTPPPPGSDDGLGSPGDTQKLPTADSIFEQYFKSGSQYDPNLNSAAPPANSSAEDINAAFDKLLNNDVSTLQPPAGTSEGIPPLSETSFIQPIESTGFGPSPAAPTQSWSEWANSAWEGATTAVSNVATAIGDAWEDATGALSDAVNSLGPKTVETPGEVTLATELAPVTTPNEEAFGPPAPPGDWVDDQIPAESNPAVKSQDAAEGAGTETTPVKEQTWGDQIKEGWDRLGVYL